MRRARAALLVVGGLGLLTGCQPLPLPLVAVYLDGQGVPQALVRTCDEDGRVLGPYLEATEQSVGRGDAWPEGPWDGWQAKGKWHAADFPLFTPPADWAVTTQGHLEYRPGLTYRFSVADPEDYAWSSRVTFGAAELTALQPGQVLTDDGAVPREQFEEEARKSC
ncbi:hypothetical protein ACIA8O_07890 [Kitasatospora sp. NPDC051853]|uniref:hypothetical protein n=1 Tax=Kitasatospora sp. NPDC051853 TaxID=3364058 RepID=UPI00379B8032